VHHAGACPAALYPCHLGTRLPLTPAVQTLLTALSSLDAAIVLDPTACTDRSPLLVASLRDLSCPPVYSAPTAARTSAAWVAIPEDVGLLLRSARIHHAGQLFPDGQLITALALETRRGDPLSLTAQASYRYLHDHQHHPDLRPQAAWSAALTPLTLQLPAPRPEIQSQRTVYLPPVHIKMANRTIKVLDGQAYLACPSWLQSVFATEAPPVHIPCAACHEDRDTPVLDPRIVRLVAAAIGVRQELFSYPTDFLAGTTRLSLQLPSETTNSQPFAWEKVKGEPSILWLPSDYAEHASPLMARLTASTPIWMAIVPDGVSIDGATKLLSVPPESLCCHVYNARPAEHRCQDKVRQGAALWVSAGATVPVCLVDMLTRMAANIYKKHPYVVSSLPNLTWEPLPYYLDPPRRVMTVGHYTEHHWFPERFASIPAQTDLLATDAGPHTLAVVSESSILLQAQTHVTVPEAESQALHLAQGYARIGRTLVVVTDAEAAMHARYAAMTAKGPLNLPLASIIAERLLLYPPAPVTVHILKAESHLCSDVNDFADDAQDPQARQDVTALAAVPGIFIHLDPNAEYPFRWFKALVQERQQATDQLLHQHHQVTVDPAVLAKAALPIERLQGVQVRRVMALRGGSLPVLVNLLSDRDHVTCAYVNTGVAAADCYLCPQDKQPETERHLFQCEAQEEEIATLRHTIAAAQELGSEDAEMLQHPHILHILAAGLAPEGFLRDLPAEERALQLVTLQKAATEGFTELWRARCLCLRRRCDELPPGSVDAQFMKHLRGKLEAELTAEPLH
jgi:hypothetical protein